MVRKSRSRKSRKRVSRRRVSRRRVSRRRVSRRRVSRRRVSRRRVSRRRVSRRRVSRKRVSRRKVSRRRVSRRRSRVSRRRRVSRRNYAMTTGVMSRHGTEAPVYGKTVFHNVLENVSTRETPEQTRIRKLREERKAAREARTKPLTNVEISGAGALSMRALAEANMVAADNRATIAAASATAADAAADAAEKQKKINKTKQEEWTSADSEAYKQVLGDPFTPPTTLTPHQASVFTRFIPSQQPESFSLSEAEKEKQKARYRLELAARQAYHTNFLDQTHALMLKHARTKNLPNLKWDEAKSMVEADLARQDLESRLKSRIDEETGTLRFI